MAAHFPWHYTQFGVLCVCGSPCDGDENCADAAVPILDACDDCGCESADHNLTSLGGGCTTCGDCEGWR